LPIAVYNGTMMNKQKRKGPELLAPAGNMEKLKAALRFGADAVYLAGQRFGMRAGADNFDLAEMKQAVEYAHALGKKVYLTVNTMPRTNEYEAGRFGLDAFIVADPGVLALCRRLAPQTPLHISTQTGVVSAADCLFWAEQGASRVVLARELSLADIKEIRRLIPKSIELEAFVHGSMCVSYSGRCLLSENILGRDANRGGCAQPCRWNFKRYEIEEEKRPGVRFPIEEGPDGAFILSSKDLCMIDHVPELMESGLDSFKIEGRMKSAYYTAVCANTYRMAMDTYETDSAGYRTNPAWREELESVTHREYATGYFFGHPMENAQLCENPGYQKEKAYLAVVTQVEGDRAFLCQRNKLCDGDAVSLLSPGRCGVPFTICDMRNEKGEPIDSAPHPYMNFSIRATVEMKPGDIIRG